MSIRPLPAVCAVLVAAPAVTAAPAPARECRDDPYVPPAAAAGSTTAGTVVFGDFVSVQVNVNGLGGNITGDAGNEPSLAVDPTAPNRMAIGWRQFDTIESNFRQAGYSWSRDGGRTWAAMNIIEPGLFRSDPVLGAGPDGTFYYLSLRVTPQNEFFTDMFISGDGGATWPDKFFAFGGDKQWFAIDDTGGPGHGNIYQAWNIAGNMYFPAQFNRSPDGGVTWEDPVVYDPSGDAFPVFGVLDVGPDGAVYVAGAMNSVATDIFWLVRSTNAADDLVTPTFDLITPLDMGGELVLGTGPNPAGLLGQVNVAVDKSGGPMDGNVYVLCSVAPFTLDPMDVHFIRSTDGGETFSEPVRVNDDPDTMGAWQWFGQMSVAPDGRIDVVWNDTRNTGRTNLSQLFYSFSTDGGETWAPNVAVSPVFDSFLGWPNQNKLGDYYHIRSDLLGADVAYAATFNGEQDVYYVRIGDRDCNGNGVPDADDLLNGDSLDCNANGVPDECDIAAGFSEDVNMDGVPDECDPACPWDCGDGDGTVGTADFLQLLAEWNTPGGCDFDGGGVGVTDFLALLANWGACK